MPGAGDPPLIQLRVHVPRGIDRQAQIVLAQQGVPTGSAAPTGARPPAPGSRGLRATLGSGLAATWRRRAIVKGRRPQGPFAPAMPPRTPRRAATADSAFQAHDRRSHIVVTSGPAHRPMARWTAQPGTIGPTGQARGMADYQ